MEEKYTVDRKTLILVCNHYRDYLMERFPRRFITAAFRMELQRALDEYQARKAKSETFFVWRIPMKVLANAATSEVDVEPAAEVDIR